MLKYCRIFLLCFCLFISFNLSSQNASIIWQQCIGGSNDDYGNCLIKTFSNQVLSIVGGSNSNDGNIQFACPSWNRNALLVQYDFNGNLINYKCYGGSFTDYFNSIMEWTNSGPLYVNYLLGKTFSVDGDVVGIHGNSDAWLVKTSANGNLIWQKCLGGESDEEGFDIIRTYDNQLLIVGLSASDTINSLPTAHHGFSWDGWLCKLDSNGNELWHRLYGGSSFDEFKSVVETDDHGFLILGSTGSNDGDVSSNLGSSDFWLVKIDSTGNLIWEKTYGGSSQDDGYSIIKLADGNFIIHGNTDSHDGNASGTHAGGGSTNILTIKIDSAGNVLWSNCFGDADGTTSRAILEDAAGFLHISAMVFSNSADAASCNIHGCCDAWLITVDPLGNLITQDCFGSSSIDGAEMGIITGAPGEYYFLGSPGVNNGDVSGEHGGDEIWLVKIIDSTLINLIIDQEVNSITLGPNPFSNILNYNNPNHISVELFLYDVMGQLILTKSLSHTSGFLDFSQLNNGLYFIVLKTAKAVTRNSIIKLHH
jgi:hypothetical protein